MTYSEIQHKAQHLLKLRNRYPNRQFKSIKNWPFILVDGKLESYKGTAYLLQEIPENSKKGRPFTHVLVRAGREHEFEMWLQNETKAPQSYAPFCEWLQNDNRVEPREKVRIQGQTLFQCIGKGDSTVRHNWYLFEYLITDVTVQPYLPENTYVFEADDGLHGVTAIRISDTVGTKPRRRMTF